MDARSSPKPSLIVKLPIRLPFMDNLNRPLSSTINHPQGLAKFDWAAQALKRAPLSLGRSNMTIHSAQQRQPLTEQFHVNNDLRAVRALCSNGPNTENDMVFTMNNHGLLNGRKSSIDIKSKDARDDTSTTNPLAGRSTNAQKTLVPFPEPDEEEGELAEYWIQAYQASNGSSEAEAKQPTIQEPLIHRDSESVPGYSRSGLGYGRSDDNDLLDGVASLSVRDSAITRRVIPFYSRQKSNKIHPYLAARLKEKELFMGFLCHQKTASSTAKRVRNYASRVKAGRSAKTQISYLSLPAEIRNLIMDYALVTQNIHFSTKAQPATYKGTLSFLPACQLLATCKQVYLEGHEMFYSLNTFHLAPGPLSVSVDYFAKLKPKHRKLLRKICIDLTIYDVTPSVAEMIEKAYAKNQGQPIVDAEHSTVIRYLQNALRDLWTAKIAAMGRSNRWDAVTIVSMINLRRFNARRGISSRSINALRMGTTMNDVEVPVAIAKLQGEGLTPLLENLHSRRGYKQWGQDPNHGYINFNDKLQSLIRTSIWHVEHALKQEFGFLHSTGSGGWLAIKPWLLNADRVVRIEPARAAIEHSWCKEKGWSSRLPDYLA